MKNILIIGAGRTSTSLINYLIGKSVEQDWFITIADQSPDLALSKSRNHPRTKAIQFDIFNEAERASLISKNDIVVSLLPEALHIQLVKDCILNRVHLVTASYVSQQMASYDAQVKNAGLIFLNEMGLDPGIDHMDTLRLISKIENKGGQIVSLRSFGGGLVSPASDDNPWGYKITWNPMNVVTAGMAGARYVQDGKLRIVPYNRIFLHTYPVEIPGVGSFEAYPNRDSIKYRRIYNVPRIPNVFRGSLRKPGFCKAWNALTQIGLTDNRYIVPDADRLTYQEWLSFYLSHSNGKTTKEKLAEFLNEPEPGELIKKIEWLGLLSEEKIELNNSTPADILLELLQKKWKFTENDKDMVILHTELEYIVEDSGERMTSTLVIYGKENFNTAMSATVGLPLGVGVKLILNNKISERGVIIPVYPDIYEPALNELAELGITFREETSQITV
ncbi:MAG: saccharopine dehydrogenase NADP-binding domain-containing protein [Ignavibacteriales bacterium]|nr:MAG: saccharopine dehydrogenase NADP-binding domain-containing protein [Ignavibacteriales bacterium]